MNTEEREIRKMLLKEYFIEHSNGRPWIAVMKDAIKPIMYPLAGPCVPFDAAQDILYRQIEAGTFHL